MLIRWCTLGVLLSGLLACGESAPRFQTLLAEVVSGGMVRVDSTHVYWADTRRPEEPISGLMRYPRAGGDQELFVEARAGDYVLEGSRVVWSERYSPGGIRWTPKSGGTPQTVVADVTDRRIATDSEHVYFMHVTAEGRFVQRASLAGGAAEIVATVTDVESIWHFAVDATHLYWCDSSNRVMKVKKDGSELPVLLASTSSPRDMLLHGAELYWVATADSGDTIYRMPTAGGEPVALATGQRKVTTLVADDRFLYWSREHDALSRSIHRLPLGGGELEEVIYPLSLFQGAFDVEGADLYFIHGSGLHVIRLQD